MKNKKPIIENYNTESFNSKIIKNPKEINIKKLESDLNINVTEKIKYKGFDFGLSDFNLVKNKTTNKLIFAYKVRLDNGLILYYIPEDITQEDKNAVFNVLNAIKLKVNGQLQLRDVKNDFDKVINDPKFKGFK